ncbi:AraC family transcriptional regulator [Thalassotalea montiporae]
MDQLSQIIQDFSIQAGVFYTGQLCGLSAFGDESHVEGHIHILHSGTLTLADADGSEQLLDEPSIVFFPRPKQHRLRATESDNAEVICATVQYGIGQQSPLTQALPEAIILPLRQATALNDSFAWMVNEALSENLGKQTILNRLMEVFIVCLLRHLITERKIEQGLLAGLSHPFLSKVISAVHNEPAHPWGLDEMAEVALMSRSKFSPLFKQVLGETPNDYLTRWRVSLAQKHLLSGKSVDHCAQLVGYESPSTLSRAFNKTCQLSPKAWLKKALEEAQQT